MMRKETGKGRNKNGKKRKENEDKTRPDSRLTKSRASGQGR